jgi:hypothetical protein
VIYSKLSSFNIAVLVFIRDLAVLVKTLVIDLLQKNFFKSITKLDFKIR